MKKILVVLLGLSMFASSIPKYISDVVIYRGDNLMVVTVPDDRGGFLVSEICIGSLQEARYGGIACHDAIPHPPIPDGLK